MKLLFVLFLILLVVFVLISRIHRSVRFSRHSSKDIIDRFLAYDAEIKKNTNHMTPPQLELLRQQLKKKYGISWRFDPDHDNKFHMDVDFADTMYVHEVRGFNVDTVTVLLASEEYRGYRVMIMCKKKVRSLKAAASISVGDKVHYSVCGKMVFPEKFCYCNSFSAFSVYPEVGREILRFDR